MNIDPEELRAERLKHPAETDKVTRAQPHGYPRWIPVVSLLALVLGLGLIVFAVQLNSRYQADRESMSAQVELLSDQLQLLGDASRQGREKIEILSSDIQSVEEGVGVTRKEVQRVKADTARVKEKQQADLSLLIGQIDTKADVGIVDELGSETGERFQQVDELISVVRQDVQTSREELEKTWKELASLGIRVTEQGGLLATNSGALEELKRRGERDYLRFDAPKKRKMKVGMVVLELRKADYKKHRADLKLYYDDKVVERKQVYTNTPLIFYVGSQRVQYELVINEVTKDQIRGYVSVPLDHLPDSTGLKRTS